MTDIALPTAPALPPAHDVPLLRLRLRLALLTMAILPTTLAMALAYSTLNGQALGETLLLADQTEAARRAVSAQLDRAATALAVLAANPQLADTLLDQDLAYEHGEALLGRSVSGLQRVTLIDSAGNTRLSLAFNRAALTPLMAPAADVAAILALPPGTIHVRGAPGEEPALLLSTPLAGSTGARSSGVLSFQLAAADLLSAARSALHEKSSEAPAQPSIFLLSPSAAVLDEVHASHGDTVDRPSGEQIIASLPARSADAGQWAMTDRWRVGMAGLGGDFDAWQVLVLHQVRPPELPVALLGLLAALTVLLVGITVWMSRQIIKPAQELARSREQLLAMYETARADALRDALTGLGNHRGFQEALDHQLDWFRRYKVPFALLLLDLDDLKVINDTRGHSAGDEVMRRMGRLIGETVRYADRPFRIGGDEFAILLPHTSADEALDLGRRLLAAALADPAGPIPFSGGVSACPALATTRNELYAQADAALYWCKRHGRAALDIFDPLRDRGADTSSLGGESSQIARVVAQSLLRAVYQPVVDLETGAVIGFEGLTRPMPESGFSNPGQLFAAAEAVGRTVELDHACIETVVSQAHGLGRGQLLSINLSPRTIEAPQFGAEWLVSLLARHEMDPRRVVIELTEQQHIEDLPRVQRNLTALQRAGIRVAVDDVGAGNAGLRLLSQFRFDIVKIDLSLVQDGTRRDSSRAVLTSLRELAGRWGAYVVAEGLETVSQLRAVRELRLSAGQGYLLGRPMAAPTLARVDLAAIDAGGVVMEVRPHDSQLHGPAVRPAS